MTYRVMLRLSDLRYTLEVNPWAGSDLGDVPEGTILCHIVEDVMPKPYFFRYLATTLGGTLSETEEGMSLSWSGTRQTVTEEIRRVSEMLSPHRYGRVGRSYVDLIGSTPLVRLERLAQGSPAQIVLKLESMEPGSVKDRTVLGIVRRAMERGHIKQDTEVVEASSGNMAFALSAILKILAGVKPTIFVSKMHGPTKRRAIRMSGSRLMLTGRDEGTLSAKRSAMEYAQKKPNTFEVNQHGNPDNVEAHRTTTGPEIYHQCFMLTGQAPAEFVCGIGTGGTAMGVGLFRQDIGAHFRIVGVEPEEAALLAGGSFSPHHFSGLSPGWVTDIAASHRDQIDALEAVSWQEAAQVCRELLIQEGFMVGPSSGASVAAALRRARLPENRGRVIVAVAHDRGDRYLEIPDLFVPPPEATESDLENER